MSKKQITRIDIDKIKNPEFLNNLSYEELDQLSEDIRGYLLDITSHNGGHLASNLGTVEATISLCKSFDFTKDKIVFDVGHQCYTYKLLTGRNLKDLRKKSGTSGFQKMSESPYDHFEAGHSSTSISVANGFAIARDLNKENYNVIAFIGDSSIPNGLSFEALNNVGANNHKVIIVLNDNNMSISKPVGGFAKAFRKFSTSGVYLQSKNIFTKLFNLTKLGKKLLRKLTRVKNWLKKKVLNITIFDTLGYTVIGPVDGHYIKQMDKAFAKAKKIKNSVVVYIKTIKGKGYKFAEKDVTGEWHGVSKFDVNTGEMINKNACATWSEQYNCILKDEMRINPKIITIAPATEHGSQLDSLFKNFPDRTIDVGISEEHAFTMSGGLSASGYHPVISIYSTFLQRAYDELSHDLARMNLNCTILIDRAGLVGNDGETHQGLYDEAFMFTIPNITITMASRTSEALSLLKESTCNHGVFAIRYPRETVSSCSEEVKKIPYGTWKEELLGKEVAIVSVGPMTLKVKNALIENKANVTLYNAIYLRPIDEVKTLELLKYNKVIIYNPYATKEGFANALSTKLIDLGYKGKIVCMTVPNEFVKQASIDEQREQFSLTVEDVLKEVNK